MNIIKDKTKRINLNLTEVYFILDKNDSPATIEFLNKLNRDKDLTQGLFKFHIMTVDKDGASSIKDFIGENNMILRLVENIGGEPQYLVNQINLNQSPENMLRNLREFLLRACRQDIVNIRKRINSYSPENPEDDDRIELFEKFMNLLEGVIEEYEEETPYGNFDSNALGRSLPRFAETVIDFYKDNLKDIRSKHKEGKLQSQDISVLLNFINDLVNIYEEPEYNSDIKIELVYERGVKNSEQGWEIRPKRLFKIYDKKNLIASIDFESKDPTVLYGLMLLKQKNQDKLRRTDLLKKNPFDPSIKWVKEVFEYLYPGENYDEWYINMVGKFPKKGHRITDAKGKINRAILKSLKNKPKLIAYLNLHGDDNENACYYQTALYADNITLPQKLYNKDVLE